MRQPLCCHLVRNFIEVSINNFITKENTQYVRFTQRIACGC